MDTDMDKRLSDNTVQNEPGEAPEYNSDVIGDIVAARRLQL